MKTRSAFALLLAAALGACDLSTEPGSLGTFTGSVSGELTATLDGSALFGSFLDGQFSMVMTDGNGIQAIAIARFTGRPGTGTHTIEHFEAETTGFIASYARDGEPQAVLRSASGQIVITSSSSTRLQGTLTFQAVGHFTADPETEIEATVTAEFDARCVRTGGSDCL